MELTIHDRTNKVYDRFSKYSSMWSESKNNSTIEKYERDSLFPKVNLKLMESYEELNWKSKGPVLVSKSILFFSVILACND